MKTLRVLLFLIAPLHAGFVNSPRTLNEKANKEFKEKHYQTALDLYRKALVKRPDAAPIHYNLGSTLYEVSSYPDSEHELQKALDETQPKSLRARALYNFGNTSYRLGHFEQAVESYKKALELDPRDEDAKFNLEFLKKKKALFEREQQKRNENENEKQQEQQQKNQQKEQQSQQQQQPSSGAQQKQNQGAGGEGQGEGQGQREKEDQTQGREKQPADQREGQKDKEEERREGEGEQEKKPETQPSEGREEKRAEQPQPIERGDPTGQGGQDSPLGLEQGGSEGERVSQAQALRILNALNEAEREMQVLRRPPPVPRSDQPPDKDW